MIEDTQDIRTRVTKRLIGGGTRLAFNEALPHVLVRRVLDLIAPLARPADGCELQQGVIDAIPYDFWTPREFVPGRVLLYSHGGGYTLFSRRTHQGLASRLAVEFAAQALVYDYRLAPEHKFPAAIDDALAAYGHLLKVGYLPQNIILAGDSAGGGITFALPLALRDLGLPLPGLLIGLSPWVDMTSSGLSMKENADKDVMLNAHGIDDFKLKYLGDCDLKHPYVSPLFANLAGLPPVMLQAAGDEILRDDSVRLAAALRAAGVQVELDVWPGLFHVFEFAWRWLPQANEAIGKLGEFVRRHYKK
ncbi:MAG: alpha/beta hydrolase [Spirochaetes bacterium]|nr:alpha/beta hydrolase [Spirochaetota bacterium]